jgi:hypothetical protein
VAVGPEVGVVGLLRGKKKRGMGWAAGLERRIERVWSCFFFSLFFFNPLLIKSFQVFKNYFKNS